MKSSYRNRKNSKSTAKVFIVILILVACAISPSVKNEFFPPEEKDFGQITEQEQPINASDKDNNDGETKNEDSNHSNIQEVSPDSGYRIGTVKLNGKSVKISKTAASYTIRNIKKSQKLEVTFEKIPGYTKPPEQENPDSTNKNNQNGSGGDAEAAKNAEAVSMTESEESKGNNTEGRNETGSGNLEASTVAGKDSAAE